MGHEGGGLHALLVCSLPGLVLELVFVETGLGQSVVSPGDKGRLATERWSPQAQRFLVVMQTHSLGSICLGPSVWPRGTGEPGTPVRTTWCACFTMGPSSRLGTLGLGQPPGSSDRLMLACQESTIKP